VATDCGRMKKYLHVIGIGIQNNLTHHAEKVLDSVREWKYYRG